MPEETRDVGVLTTSRADYGLLTPLLDELRSSPNFNLKLYVTGSHLLESHGKTIENIREDGFTIEAEVDYDLEGDSPRDVVNAMGRETLQFSNCLSRETLDLFFVLGDRYELLPPAQVALINRIPMAHLHGGELTEGAIDDSIRHALTKLSHLHFTATASYRKRVIQLGEQPDRVFNVGALGLDKISETDLKHRKELENDLNLDLTSPLLLVTYHPVTTPAGGTQDNGAGELLEALRDFSEGTVVFTHPNADPGHKTILNKIDNFVDITNFSHFFSNLGSRNYLSLMDHADAVVGNSSSGILEAPFLGTPTVNVGSRQRGRVKDPSVIDCEDNSRAIRKAIIKALANNFRENLTPGDSIYGDGNAAKRIVNHLVETGFEELIPKPFYEVDFEVGS